MTGGPGDPDLADDRTLALPRTALGTLTRTNAGGSGVLHRVADSAVAGMPGVLVYKEYRDPPGEALTADLYDIVRVRQRIGPAQATVLDEMTVWPLRVVNGGDGRPTGILMRLIPPEFFETISLPSGTVATVPREIQHLVYDPAVARTRGVAVPADGALATRLLLCERLAHVLAVLHEAGVVYGDLSARNILYTLAPAPSVLLVDCDGARTGKAGSPQHHTPDWDPPEDAAPGRVDAATHQSVQTDRYKLALFVLRCLTPGRFSSVNREPTAAAGVLDQVGRALLARGLDSAPADRPTADEWRAYFRDLLAR